MKPILVLGLVLMLVGGGLMIFGYVTYRDTDPVIDIGKLEITKTTTKRKPIPLVLSGTILGVGAALTVVGAMKKK